MPDLVYRMSGICRGKQGDLYTISEVLLKYVYLFRFVAANGIQHYTIAKA